MDNGGVFVDRPRLSVDFATVLRLREVENLGWARMATTYRPVRQPGYHQAQVPGGKIA